MKINAQFYLKFYDPEPTEISIFSMNDLSAIPFKVGDLIYLDIKEIFPKDLEEYTDEAKRIFSASHEKCTKMFDRKTIEIIRVGNYARFNALMDGSMTVEYLCRFYPED